MERYCEIGDCDRPAFRDGKCSTHVKQLQRTGKTAPIAEKLSLEERLIVAHAALMEADSDEDHERHRRAMLLAAKALGKKEVSLAIRASMDAAKARGVRLGRPPKVTTERVLELVRLLRKPSLVAQVLGIHRDTVYWHLSRRKKKAFPTTAESPRLTG